MKNPVDFHEKSGILKVDWQTTKKGDHMNYQQRNEVIDLNESIRFDPPSYYGLENTVLFNSQKKRIFDDLSSDYALYCIDQGLQEEEMNILVEAFENDLRFLDDDDILYMEFNGIFSLPDFEQKYKQ